MRQVISKLETGQCKIARLRDRKEEKILKIDKILSLTTPAGRETANGYRISLGDDES